MVGSPTAYLVESVEFWSMRDLVDVSKGAFATLPAVLNQAGQVIQRFTWEQTKKSLQRETRHQA